MDDQNPTTTASKAGVCDRGELKNQVMSITEIWKKLGHYLNYGDLKSLRLVNKQFNNCILNETNFINQSFVSLDQDHLYSSDFGSTSTLWKHFGIELQLVDEIENSRENWSWLYPRLSRAQSLALTMAEDHLTQNRSTFFQNQEFFSVPPLNYLLVAPEKLLNLSFGAEVLINPYILSQLDNLSSAAKSVITKIEQLNIYNQTSVLENDPLTRMNFNSSLSLFCPLFKNLKVLEIGQLFGESNTIFPFFPLTSDSPLFEQIILARQITQTISKIVEQNMKTLTHLCIMDSYAWRVEEMEPEVDHKWIVQMNFPNLKSFVVGDFNSASTETELVPFFHQLPELEELDITMLPLFNNDLLSKIQEKSGNLRKLNIKTTEFSTQESEQWIFLQDLNLLEEFGLEFIPSQNCEQNCQNYKSVLSHLPKSIRKITLRNFKYFYRLNERLNESDFEQYHFDLRFLTHLTLNDIPGAVDDQLLDFIFKNMKSLQYLDVFGSRLQAGAKSSSGTFSPVNLQGLCSLAFDCENLGDCWMNLVQNIRFQQLKVLGINFQGTTVVDKKMVLSFISEILKNNPSLEFLSTMNLSYYETSLPTISNIQKHNPNSRIRQVLFMHS